MLLLSGILWLVLDDPLLGHFLYLVYLVVVLTSDLSTVAAIRVSAVPIPVSAAAGQTYLSRWMGARIRDGRRRPRRVVKLVAFVRTLVVVVLGLLSDRFELVSVGHGGGLVLKLAMRAVEAHLQVVAAAVLDCLAVVVVEGAGDFVELDGSPSLLGIYLAKNLWRPHGQPPPLNDPILHGLITIQAIHHVGHIILYCSVVDGHRNDIESLVDLIHIFFCVML